MIEQILQADRLMQVDQIQQARGIYQRVVDADPGNAIAVVGLAQCALADGDEAEAHGLAARALSIDPQNDMARRMEARLAEILAARGWPVERPKAATQQMPRTMRPVVTGTPTRTGPEGPGGDASPGRSRPPAPTPAAPKSLLDRLLGR